MESDLTVVPDETKKLNEEHNSNSNNNSDNNPNTNANANGNGKQLYFSELEMNTEFDESINFSHYFSVYRDFASADESTLPFPFLTNLEYMFSYFDDIRPIKEPHKESTESIKGRIKQFASSKDDNVKKQFLDNLRIYAETLGMETTSYLLIPALAKIVDESLAIKLKFLQVNLEFIDFLCENGSDGYNIIKNNLLNIIDELYHPHPSQNDYLIKDEEMKQLLMENFIKIAKSLTTEDKSNEILHKILSFANNDNSEPLHTEQKMLCITLISKLAGEFTQECTENYFIPELYSFSDENNTVMKQEVLKTIPEICEVISIEMIKVKVYDIIKRLSNDLIWNVRKTCVSVIPKIIKINKEKALYHHTQSHNELYVGLIEKLIMDNQKYVRIAILEKIGEIIYQLDKSELSSKLFDFYKNSIEEYFFNIKDKLSNTNNNKASSNTHSHTFKKDSLGFGEIVYYCAYNFPAVLYCYGSAYWEQLRKIYVNLCNENDDNVRRSIISSFHEICSILGPETTENELLPIYNMYLDSDNPKEKNIALRNLPKILKIVSKQTKENYFKYFDAVSLFQNNEGSNTIRNFNFITWSNKVDVVESILCYYNLYENDTIYKVILPQVIAFAIDDVYKVRTHSSKVLANIIVHFYNENYNKDKIVQLIHTFAFHKKYHNRVSFVKMCKVFSFNYAMYKEVVKDILFKLVFDRVINVRIALARTLRKIIVDEKNPCHNDNDVLTMCKLLKWNRGQSAIKCIDDTFYGIKLDKTGDKQEDIVSKYGQQEYLKFGGNDDLLINEFHIEI